MKKTYSILLIIAVAMFCFVGGANAQTYKMITSLDDLVDGEYVIGSAVKDNEEATVVMSSTLLSKGRLDEVSGSFSNGSIELSDETKIWRIEKNGTSYTIQSVATSKYVSSGGSSLSFTDTSSSDAEKWNVTYSGGRFKFKSVGSSTYYLQYNSSSKWFAGYENNSNQQNLFLYKKEVVSTTPSTVTFVDGSTTTTLSETAAGDGVTPPANTLSASCATQGWEFAGWSTTQLTAETTTAPGIVTDGTGTYFPASDITLYSVYQLGSDIPATSCGSSALGDWIVENSGESGYWKIFKDDYMQTPSFTSAYVESITIQMGTYGGDSGDVLQIENNDVVIATATATSNSESKSYTIDINQTLSGTLKFSSNTTNANAGLRIKSITINTASTYSSSPNCDVVTPTVETPTFSVAGGDVTEATSVEITCATTGASIYYTTNGTTPTASSTQYTSAITISETTTLKAIAIKDGGSSDVATATYTYIAHGSNVDDYVKVTTAQTDWSGTYIMVCEETEESYFMIFAGVTTNDWGDTIHAPTYLTEAALSQYEVTITKTSNGYSIEQNNGEYLTLSKDENKLFAGDYTTSQSDWKLSYAQKGTISNINYSSRKLQYNASNPRFACYTSSQKPVYLYKKISSGTPTVATPTFSPEGGDITEATDVTISCTTAGASIYYTTDGTEPTSSSTLYSTTPISITETTTLKAIAIKGDDKSKIVTAEYKFLPTIKDFIDGEGSLNNKPLNDVTVTHQYYNPDTKDTYTWIQDATGSLMIFDENGTYETLENGNVLSGLKGVHGVYQNAVQIQTASHESVSSGDAVSPAEVEIVDLDHSDTHRYINLVGSVTEYVVLNNDEKDVVLEDKDGNEIKIYTKFKNINETLNAGDIIEIDGLVSSYNDVINVFPKFIRIPVEHEVNFVDGSNTTTIKENRFQSGKGVTPPDVTISSECAEQGWVLAGWSETQLTAETTTQPTIVVKPSEVYYPQSNDVTLYAVYQQGVIAPTTSYSSNNSDWTVNAGTPLASGSDDYWRIYSGHFITSPSFTDLYVESVTIKMGTFGGCTDENKAGVLQVQNGGVVIATETASGSDETIYTVNINRIISGELVFSSQTELEKTGLRIQEITLNTAPVYFNPNAPSCVDGIDVNTAADASAYEYRSNLTVKEGATLTCTDTDVLYFTNVVLEAGAKLAIDDNAKFVANSLVLHTLKETKTAEIEYNDTDLVTNITFARKLNKDRYYFVSLPCKYKVSDITNAAGDILELYDGSNASTADIDVVFYDGNVRAKNPEGILAGTASSWTSMKGDDYIKAGVGYNIYVGERMTLYFPKVSTADIKQSTASSVKVFGARRSENEGWNLITHTLLSTLYNPRYFKRVNINYVSYFDGKNNTYSQESTSDSLSLMPFVPFFVQSGATCDISYAEDATTQSSAPALSRDITTETFKFIIANCNDSEKSDVTTLIVNDDYTTDYEIGDDLSKMLSVGSSCPQMYSSYGNIQYAFNAIPKSAITATNLGVYLYEAGDYSISLDIKNGEYETVYLIDNVTNTKHNLINGSYYFTTDGTVYNNSRFSIEMRRVVTGCENASDDKYIVYSLNSDIYIENLSGEGAVNVYDVAGHLITKQQVVSSDLNITSLPAGIYMVTIEDEQSFNSYKVVVR